MNYIKDNEKRIINTIIDELLRNYEMMLPNSKFKDGDSVYKIKILKMMFQANKEEEILHNNIKNIFSKFENIYN